MQLSPLQLEDYLLKELRFALISPLTEIPGPDIKYDLLNIEVNAVTAQRADDPLHWRSEVTIRSKDEDEGNFPYTFKLIYVGFFRVAPDFPPDRVEQMVRTNAPSLLYSAAREAILYLTGRGRSPAILLPSITFIEPPGQPSKKASTKRKLAKKK